MKTVSEELRELAEFLEDVAVCDDEERSDGGVARERAIATRNLATRCEGMHSADQVIDVAAAVNDLLARIAKSDYYNDARMDKVRDAVVRLGSVKPMGVVSFDAVEEVVRAELTATGEMMETSVNFTVKRIMTRLKEGS